MLRRSPAGKDRRNGTAGLTELHIDPFTVRQQPGQKIVVIDDLPPQSIYKYEDFNISVFHIYLTAKPDIRVVYGNPQRVSAFSNRQRAKPVFLSDIR